MLLKLRDKVTGGKVAVVIVVLLAIPFAFFGIGNYFSATADTNVASIELPGKWYSVGPIGRETRDIGEQAYRARLDQARLQMRQVMGEDYDGAMFDDPSVRREILDQMVEEELLLIAAERDNLAVSNAQVAAEIQSIPAFQVDGRFDIDQYRLALASQSPPISPAQFDSRVRSELTRRLIPTEIGETAFATEADVDSYLSLRDQRRDFSYVALPLVESDAAELTDEEVRAWFDENQQRYLTEEQVVLEYVEVRGDDIEVSDRIDEQTLLDRYEEQRARYVTPEERLTSHVLLLVDPSADEAAWDAVRERAQGLVAEIDAGADFGDIAREHSEDPGSSEDGGDLGWIEPGLFGDEFDEAVFAAETGVVTGPVRTGDGWHLIEVRDTREGAAVAFEDVRDEIEAEVLATERDRAFSERSGRMMDIVYRDGSSLQPVAESLGIEIQRTEAFGRAGGEGIAGNPEVIRTAFASQLVGGDEISGGIEIDLDHLVVIRVAEYRPAEPIALEEVRDEVEQSIRSERQAAAAQQAADAMLARARDGETLEAIAEEVGAEVSRREDASRAGAAVDRAVLDRAFTLPRPRDAERSLALAQSGSQAFVLIELHGVSEGDPTAVGAQERSELREQLGRARADLESRAYIDALRQQYPVRVVENRL